MLKKKDLYLTVLNFGIKCITFNNLWIISFVLSFYNEIFLIVISICDKKLVYVIVNLIGLNVRSCVKYLVLLTLFLVYNKK